MSILLILSIAANPQRLKSPPRLAYCLSIHTLYLALCLSASRCDSWGTTGAIFIRISCAILLCSCPSEMSGFFYLGMSFFQFESENVTWWYFGYIVTKISTQKSLLHKKLQVFPLPITSYK